MVKPATAAFVERLPSRPYCTNDKSAGLLIRPQATALAYRHIQHNPPPHCLGSLLYQKALLNNQNLNLMVASGPS
ncbi:replication primase [Aeromonas media WS]|nr:replication primase [Aeromonas media WS]